MEVRGFKVGNCKGIFVVMFMLKLKRIEQGKGSKIVWLVIYLGERLFRKANLDDNLYVSLKIGTIERF